MVDSRNSVYYLSSFASFLQSHNAPFQLYDVQNAPSGQSLSRSWIVNYLATFFSRGRVQSDSRYNQNEKSRVVVVAGSILFDSMGLFVTTTSPNITPTSASAMNPSCISEIPTKADVPETRGKNEDGFWIQQVIPAAEDFASVSSLSEQVELPFAEFVVLALRLLRSAATHIRSQPTTASDTRRLVICFFLRSCRHKLKARLRAVTRTFNFDKLRTWVPTDDEEIPSAEVKIANLSLWARQLLSDAGVQSSGEVFSFTKDNMSLWWTCLLQMLAGLDTAVEACPAAEVKSIAAASERLHDFLRVLPTALWQSESLRKHLQRSRSSAHDEAAEKEPDPPVGAHPFDGSKLENATTEARAFYCAVDAICAWTTGTKYLLNSTMSRSTAPLLVSIVNLPPQEMRIGASSVEALVEHWTPIAQWPDIIQQSVKASLVDFQVKLSANAVSEATAWTSTNLISPALAKGNCYCEEAGLVASLYLRQKNPPTEDEFTVVTNGFAHLTVTPDDAFTIGVADKCCPVCKMLIDILRTKYGLEVHIPAGAHNRFRPWIAPHELPDDVMKDLEERLVDVVGTIVLVRDSRPYNTRSPVELDWDDDERQ
ncbi:hypothetical protein C8R45DRAFT_1020937 [Mycena sanguinolenta]|nr:hypothetical protein C8R45DRAFT_1020937 [Mycena sanguinolenta]